MDEPFEHSNISSSRSFSQLLAFLQGLFTFYHEGYELAHEFEPYKQQLQFNLQNVRVHFTHHATRDAGNEKERHSVYKTN